MEGATLQKIAQQAVDGKVSVEQVQQAKGSLSPPTVRADVAASAANKILTSEPPQNPTDLAARTNEPNSADKGWGWSKWLPSSAAIQEAAAGALRDVRELNESLQQALAIDKTDTEDDTDPNTSTQQSLPEEDAAQSYKPVLDRLEGNDSPLAAGLKAVDGQVGLLAEGVAGLAGTLWSEARTASIHVAGQMEDGLKLFGRVAIELLDGGLEAELHAAQGRPATEAPFNFTTCYHGCGGLKRSEELEELCSESARLCNRLRAKLKPIACSQMDQELAALAPIFQLEDNAKEDAAEEGSDDDSAIGKGHSKIEEFCRKGRKRAESLGQSGSEAAADLTSMQSAAVLALAQLVTLCVGQLLSLARSLAASACSRTPENNAIEWPLDCGTTAALLRTQVLRMIHALEGLTQTYSDALRRTAAEEAGKETPQPGIKDVVSEKKDASQDQIDPSGYSANQDKDASAKSKEAHQCELSKRAEVAANKVKHGGSVPKAEHSELPAVLEAVGQCSSEAKAQICESFRGLLFVVLLSSLDRALLSESDASG